MQTGRLKVIHCPFVCRLPKLLPFGYQKANRFYCASDHAKARNNSVNSPQAFRDAMQELSVWPYGLIPVQELSLF